MLKERPNHLNKKAISCIINPHAANKKWKRNILVRTYLRKNLPGQIIETFKDKAYTIQTAKQLSSDHDIIVAAGGDGTVADVIQGIVESGMKSHIALGVIPLGSGNAFRKSLGIPKNIRKALKIIHDSQTREIDLIEVEGKVATFASIGATASITMKKLHHKIPGFLGHLLASRKMLNLPSHEMEIELIDGREDSGKHFDRKNLKLKAFDCVTAKTNHFGYSWKVAPKAVIDDGYLDITFFELSGIKYFVHFPRIYFGTFQKTQKHYKTKKIVLRGKDLPIQYNGELLGLKDKIEMKVLPRAIKVICPIQN